MRRLDASLWCVIAQEHQIVRLGLLGAVTIALNVELLEGSRIVDAFFDDEATHQAAGLFRVETDDLVLVVLQVLELGIDAVSYTHLTLPTNREV